MVNLKHVCPMFDCLDNTEKAKFSKIYHFLTKKGKNKLSFITSLCISHFQKHIKESLILHGLGIS